MTTTQPIQPANLPKGAFLLTDSYQPENVTFSLWVVQRNKNYELVAVTLPGHGTDFMEALDEKFVKFAQDYAEWEYLAGHRVPELLGAAPSQFRAAGAA